MNSDIEINVHDFASQPDLNPKKHLGSLLIVIFSAKGCFYVNLKSFAVMLYFSGAKFMIASM